MSIKKFFVVILLIMLAGRSSIAEESKPQFTKVNSGEVAPFTGYLFTPEAISKVVSKSEEAVNKVRAECTASTDSLQLDLKRAAELSAATIASKERSIIEITESKKRELEERNRQIKLLEGDKVFGNFLIAGSFVAGIALTVGIVYITNGVAR